MLGIPGSLGLEEIEGAVVGLQGVGGRCRRKTPLALGRGEANTPS
jgi:hypothetical protein